MGCLGVVSLLTIKLDNRQATQASDLMIRGPLLKGLACRRLASHFFDTGKKGQTRTSLLGSLPTEK